ncbi:MAG: transporter related [Firmicutes bacterium]|nr:transporter related [Bacillota bacterium]
MIDIALRDIEKYYGAHHLLKGVTFEVKTGDRVGLLGRNGTGKSTLFYILEGRVASDIGEKMLRKGAVVSLLEQTPEFVVECTAYDALYSAFSDLLEVKKQMTVLEEVMAKQLEESDTLQKYGQLQQIFESREGYAMEENFGRVCIGLGLSSELLATSFSALSGGEKTRVMLGKLLLKKPDILLLDEPTNHLDVTAVEWLEGYLSEYKGTVVVISHDRYFLNKVVTRVIELVEGKVELYEGNYTSFREEKTARNNRQRQQFEQQQKQLKQMERAAKRMHEWAQRADNPSMHKRAFAMEKRMERVEKIERPRREALMKSRFSEQTFSGQEALIARNLQKNFGEQNLLNGLDFTLYKGERVALLGANGTGKSTLFKLIVDEMEADAGEVRLGDSIRAAYLPQIITFGQPERSVLDIARYELGIEEGEARRILAKYLFRGEDVYRKTENLSGGEKSRLCLCLLMQGDVNLLLLDEPTNHLDIDSREWLEEALDEFNGTVLFISHDRYFISTFATQIWELANGRLTKYPGDYLYYRQKYIERRDVTGQNERTCNSSAGNSPSPEEKVEAKSSSRKVLSPDKAAAASERLERAIEEMENALKAIEARMQKCNSDFTALEPLLRQKGEWEKERDALYCEWLELAKV